MKEIKLSFSGDIMLKNSMLKDYNKDGNYNFDSIFCNVKDLLSKNDYLVGNLETPISSDLSRLKSELYRFTSPYEFAEAVKNVGFDLVSTANNHCLDNGLDGVKETLDCLKNIGLKNTGIYVSNEELIIEDINGIKVGFLSYTYGTNAFSNKVYLSKKSDVHVNLFQNQEDSCFIKRKIYYGRNIVSRIMRKIMKVLKYDQVFLEPFERNEFSFFHNIEIKNKIKKIKKMGADYVIMLMHEGGQYNTKPCKKTLRRVKMLKKYGVDFIVGNHEHTINLIEKDNVCSVAFSLGNFDGIAGVYSEPFDKYSEYSLLLNIYLTNEDNHIKNTKISFNVLKTIKDSENGNDSIKVVSLFDLYSESNKDEKEKLLKDYNAILKIVTGKESNESKIKDEIFI